MYSFDVKLDEKGLPDKLERHASEISPHFIKKVTQMLKTIQGNVQFNTPRGDHCQGKGGTAKSAIKHKITENGGEVYGDTGTAPHLRFLIEGRGPVTAYGSNSYLGKDIGTKKALRFCINGKVIFVRSVKASKPNDIFRKGYQASQGSIQRQAGELTQWLNTL